MVSNQSLLTRKYRSLSSVGKSLLPEAERMHREGKSWRMIAEELGVSNSILYVWRKLEREV